MLSVTGGKKIRVIKGGGKENLYKINAMLIKFGKIKVGKRNKEADIKQALHQRK